jgi:hypothetical protein
MAEFQTQSEILEQVRRAGGIAAINVNGTPMNFVSADDLQREFAEMLVAKIAPNGNGNGHGAPTENLNGNGNHPVEP